MLPGLVIGLREGLETVVIVGAIVVFLRVHNRGDLVRSVAKASAMAAAICIVLAIGLRLVEAGLPLRPQQALQTIISVAAVLMVTYMIVWMRAFPKDHLSDSRHAAAGGHRPERRPGPGADGVLRRASRRH